MEYFAAKVTFSENDGLNRGFAVPIPKNFTNFLHLAIFGALLPLSVAAQENWSIQPVVTDLDTPWAVAPMPDGAVLITEKDGRLLLQRDGAQIGRASCRERV